MIAMPLTRALYYSKASRPHGAPEEQLLDDILQASRRNNEASGVTGFLLYSGGHFLQVLEGRRGPLSQTLQRIFADKRHADMGLIDLRAVPERKFGNWSMYSYATGYDETIDKIVAQQVNAENAKTPVFDADQIMAILQFVALHKDCGAVSITEAA